MANIFHDARLPQTVSYRSRREHSTQVQQFVSDSGDISVKVDTRVMFNYTATFGDRSFVEVAELRRFYFCRSGALFPFRFNDPLDNSSGGQVGVPNTFSATDQPVFTAPNGTFFLAKLYGMSYRIIKLPYTETIVFARSGSPVSGLTVNGRTGRVGGITDATNLTWGGNFDVPVRFSTPFNVTYNEYDYLDVELGLDEVVDTIVDGEV